MRWFYKIPLRLRSVFRKNRVEKELTEELRFHLEQHAADLEARGIPRAEARALAGGDALTNARSVHAVLAGEKGPHRDIAVLNAAAALVVSGVASDLASGVDAGAASIDGGHAARALERLVRASGDAMASERVS